MSASKRPPGPAYKARLERLIKRRRSATQPAAPALTSPNLTYKQKTASEPRLRGARVAQPQQI
jgi:hypothetical protein